MLLILGCIVGAITMAFVYRLLAVYNRTELMRRPSMVLLSIAVHVLAGAPMIFYIRTAVLDDHDTHSKLQKVIAAMASVAYTVGRGQGKGMSLWDPKVLKMYGRGYQRQLFGSFAHQSFTSPERVCP